MPAPPPGGTLVWPASAQFPPRSCSPSPGRQAEHAAISPKGAARPAVPSNCMCTAAATTGVGCIQTATVDCPSHPKLSNDVAGVLVRGQRVLQSSQRRQSVEAQQPLAAAPPAAPGAAADPLGSLASRRGCSKLGAENPDQVGIPAGGCGKPPGAKWPHACCPALLPPAFAASCAWIGLTAGAPVTALVSCRRCRRPHSWRPSRRRRNLHHSSTGPSLPSWNAGLGRPVSSCDPLMLWRRMLCCRSGCLTGRSTHLLEL